MTAREFILGLPAKVPPETIEGLATVFHFDIDGAEGGKYTISIQDGSCKVEEGLSGEARCSVTGTADNLMDVVTGKTNAMMAMLMGKVKISNQGEMLKYAKIFGLL